MFCRYSELTIFMNNLSSYCGIVDAKIRASDKDLPVLINADFEFLKVMDNLYLKFRYEATKRYLPI